MLRFYRLLAHARFPALARTMRSCSDLATAWSGAVVRSAAPAYASTDDIVTGLGSLRSGGRWNPRDSFLTVYASTDPETAMSETMATARYYGWPDGSLLPRLFRSIDVELSRVLDLRRPEVVRKLARWLKETADEDWRKSQDERRESVSQSLGRAAFESGLEGLLAPSHARIGGTNLVVFPQRLLPGSSLVAR